MCALRMNGFSKEEAVSTIVDLATLPEIKFQLARYGVSTKFSDKTLAAESLVGHGQLSNQQRFSGTLIDITYRRTNGGISAHDLQIALMEVFPTAQIGDRHGKHYLSKARKGNLECVSSGLRIPMEAKRKADKPQPCDNPIVTDDTDGDNCQDSE